MSASKSRTQDTARGPGRPRSAQAQEAIHRATLASLAERGFEATSIEGVASAAGVAKTTIYRRYDSKTELVADALRALPTSFDAPVYSGDIRSDLVTNLQAENRLMKASGAAFFFPRLMVEGARDPELFAVLSETIVAPRRAASKALFQAAIDAGELRSDVDLDDLVDVMIGPLAYRVLITAGDLDAIHELIPRLVDLTLEGARVPKRAAPTKRRK